MGCGPSSSKAVQHAPQVGPGIAHRRASAAKKHDVVYDELEGLDADYQIPVFPKSDKALMRIADACKDNTLFAGVGEEQCKKLFIAMEPIIVQPGTLVIQQGEQGDKYYVIESGEYEVLLKQNDDEPVHRYIGSGSFGELALLFQVPRASTIRCVVAGSLWALDRKTFRHMLMTYNKEEVDQTARFLQAVEILSPLTDKQRAKLASVMEQISYADGETLWEVGDRADWLCLIKRGTVISTSSYREPLTFKVGSFFGTQVCKRAARGRHDAWPPPFLSQGHRPCYSYPVPTHTHSHLSLAPVFATHTGTERRPEHEANCQGHRRWSGSSLQADTKVRGRALR